MTEPDRAVPLLTRTQHLARLMRQRRADLSLTQEQVADLIGVRKGTIGAWEKGGSRATTADGPQPRHWAAIAQFLELDGAPAVRRILEGAPAEELKTLDVRPTDDIRAVRQVLARMEQGAMSEAEIRLAERLLDALRSRS